MLWIKGVLPDQHIFLMAFGHIDNCNRHMDSNKEEETGTTGWDTASQVPQHLNLSQETLHF